MNKFRCIPISVGIPIAFFSLSIIQIGLTWYYWINMHDIKDIYVGAVIFLLGSFLAIITSFPTFRRVELLQDKVICKGLFPHDTFEIEYERCNVGIDHHCQYGRKIWWICLYYGPHPKFKMPNKANRINTLKIEPGFIKIMYSDEVYYALLSKLPKKQKIALETSRRYAKFEKQGRIVL